MSKEQGTMRALACITGVVGGACWVSSAFLSGGLGDYAFYGGCGLLSVAAMLAGFQVVSGSLPWLRVVVGVGCVALAWSLVAALRSGVDADLLSGLLGGLAVVLGLVGLARTERPERVGGTHSR
jgi:hypothetical protein